MERIHRRRYSVRCRHGSQERKHIFYFVSKALKLGSFVFAEASNLPVCPFIHTPFVCNFVFNQGSQGLATHKRNRSDQKKSSVTASAGDVGCRRTREPQIGSATTTHCTRPNDFFSNKFSNTSIQKSFLSFTTYQPPLKTHPSDM